MSRLPIPGSDDGVWGIVLNDFLSVEHNTDGTLKASGTISEKVDSTVAVSAGTGLSGGGDLSTSRTISANFGATSGTVAEGNDSRITGAVQSTTVDAKGDLLIASAADTVTRLGIGTDGQTLVANSGATNGMQWATTGGYGSTYPTSAYGFFSASDNISLFTGTSVVEQAYFVRMFIPAGRAINALGTYIRNAGTVGAGGLNGFAVYTDAGVLVDYTANDDNLWTSVGWFAKAFSSPIAAQATDRFVYCAYASRGYSSAPYIPYFVTYDPFLEGGYGITNRRAFYSSINSWPASFDPASYGANMTGYLGLLCVT